MQIATSATNLTCEIVLVISGHDIFQTGQDVGSMKQPQGDFDSTQVSDYRQGCFNLLVYVPFVCAISQLAVWTQFKLHGRRLQWIKSMRQDTTHYV